jgi:hypothetical protein
MEALSRINSLGAIIVDFCTFNRSNIIKWSNEDDGGKYLSNILALISAIIVIHAFTISTFTGPSSDLTRFNPKIFSENLSCAISVIAAVAFFRWLNKSPIILRSALAISLIYGVVSAVIIMVISFAMSMSEPFATDTKLLKTGSAVRTVLSARVCDSVISDIRLLKTAEDSLRSQKFAHYCTANASRCAHAGASYKSICDKTKIRCEDSLAVMSKSLENLYKEIYAIKQHNDYLESLFSIKYKLIVALYSFWKAVNLILYVFLVLWAIILIYDDYKKISARRILSSISIFSVIFMSTIASQTAIDYVLNTEPSMNQYIESTVLFIQTEPNNEDILRMRSNYLSNLRNIVIFDLNEHRKYCPNLRNITL